MPQITALFWDLGGVLLSNAWDRSQRLGALEHFQLDETEFHLRHQPLVPPFERGEVSLDEYLEQTVFYQARTFTREAFKNYMFSLSKENSETLRLARGLAGPGKYLMATVNNESRELNQYRIERFGLREILSVFISSCFVGLRKPEERIYRLALELIQKPPEQCCFIDDRAENLDWPRQMGMHAIQMQGIGPLREDLAKLGVVP